LLLVIVTLGFAFLVLALLLVIVTLSFALFVLPVMVGLRLALRMIVTCVVVVLLLGLARRRICDEHRR
jgi:hypothetical protein